MLCAQDTLVVTVMSPALGMDDELGRVEVSMSDIRAAVQVRRAQEHRCRGRGQFVVKLRCYRVLDCRHLVTGSAGLPGWL
jgi:hypothetical protein